MLGHRAIRLTLTPINARARNFLVQSMSTPCAATQSKTGGTYCIETDGWVVSHLSRLLLCIRTNRRVIYNPSLVFFVASPPATCSKYSRSESRMHLKREKREKAHEVIHLEEGCKEVQFTGFISNNAVSLSLLIAKLPNLLNI